MWRCLAPPPPSSQPDPPECPLPLRSQIQDRVEDRRSKVSLAAILRGDALGTQLRWARLEATALLNEGHRAEHELLSHHIEMAEVALALADKKSKDMRKDDFMQKLRTLHEYGVAWPSTTEDTLFYRFCDELVGNMDLQAVEQYLRAVIPWHLEGDDEHIPDEACGETPSGFQPCSPKLADMQGSDN